jgi:hypothetical protein
MSHQDVMLKLDELHSKVISYVKNSNNTKKNYTECEIHLKSINYIYLELENLAELSFKENINIKEKNDFLNNQIIKLQKTNEFLNFKNNELQKQNELQGEAINKHIISDDNQKNDSIKKLKKENSNLLLRLDFNDFAIKNNNELKLKNTKLQKRIVLYKERLAEQEITINKFEDDKQILRLQDFDLQQINKEYQKFNTELENDYNYLILENKEYQEFNKELQTNYDILLLENESLDIFIREQTEQMTQLNSIIESFKQVYNTTQQSSTPLSNINKSNQSYSSIPHSPPPSFSYTQGTPNTPPL